MFLVCKKESCGKFKQRYFKKRVTVVTEVNIYGKETGILETNVDGKYYCYVCNQEAFDREVNNMDPNKRSELVKALWDFHRWLGFKTVVELDVALNDLTDDNALMVKNSIAAIRNILG